MVLTQGSSAGALTQLVATGAMDQAMSQNASHTFWRTTFARATRFSMESVVQSFSRNPAFGEEVDIQLNRTGDLVYHMYIQIDLPGIALKQKEHGGPAMNVRHTEPCNPCKDTPLSDKSRHEDYGGCDSCGNGAIEIDRSAVKHEDLDDCPWVHWTNAIGQYIVDEARIAVGGQRVDEIWGDYLFCYEELSGKVGRRLLEMVGKRYSRKELLIDSSESRRLYVPLPFWFTQASGHALPLTSLQFHSVSLQVRFQPLDRCVVVNMPHDGDGPIWPHYDVVNCKTGQPLHKNDLDANLLTSYVYLDQSERERFAQQSMEIIAYQHQRQVVGSTGTEIRDDLRFNHPVTELIWFVRRKCNEIHGAHFNFSGLEMRDPIKEVKLSLNSQERLGGQTADYYRLVQPYQHHSCIPDTFVYCYSFALHPEDTTTPSGSCNLSRIDTAHMNVSLQHGLGPVDLVIFATNWNVFRIREGLMGVAYSN